MSADDIVKIITALTPIIASLLAAYGSWLAYQKGVRNQKLIGDVKDKTNETHELINNRMDQLLETTKETALAAAERAGVAAFQSAKEEKP